MSNMTKFDQTKLSDPLEIFVDPRARRSTTRSIYRQLREAIASDRVSAGDRLPPSRALAAQLGVSRHTITTVYDQLVAEGYLSGRAGGGTFVNPATPRPIVAGKPSDARQADSAATSGSSTFVPRFDLRPGAPDPMLFPTLVWRRCTVAALQHPPGGYGDPSGTPALRETIAHWIDRSRGLQTSAEQIVVTSGAQQAIELIIRLLVKPGDIVAVEDPGYVPVRQLCAAFGADVRPVPVDGEGLVVDRIPPGTRVVYTTPAHQYPTGVVMSLPRRLALLDHADRHDVTIIEDDYDSEYRHVARPLEPLQRLDRNERVIYVDTFSKTLSPALRLGFAVLPHPLIGEFLGRAPTLRLATRGATANGDDPLHRRRSPRPPPAPNRQDLQRTASCCHRVPGAGRQRTAAARLHADMRWAARHRHAPRRQRRSRGARRR